MKTEDALRMIALRRKNTDNEAAAPEAETAAAAHLQEALMERYAITAQNIFSRTTVSRLTWTYWQELLKEFGLRLDQFGQRGMAAAGNNSKVHIRLDKNQWWIEERFPGGWQTTARNWGVESLRKYLNEHAPRS